MMLRKGDLQIVTDDSLSFYRRRYGKGFQFYNQANNKVVDKKLLKRFRSLVIPPMWSDVQICKWEDGHIQAVGRDKKGRKQYIYHSEWERQRQLEKFEKIIDFGKQLKLIRKRALQDVCRQTWSKEKIVALLVLILDETGIRIGNKQYVHKNNTYGLTTLRRRHMTVEEGLLTFEFKGKSNKMREVTIEDDRLLRLIRKSAELPGYELFRFRDSSGKFVPIDSDDVNRYIKSTMGEEFYSKDFRTWGATRMAVELYPSALKVKEQQPRRSFVNILLRMVANELGNTPSVCKSYYVHPRIMQGIEQQNLPSYKSYEEDTKDYGLSASEKFIIDYLTS